MPRVRSRIARDTRATTLFCVGAAALLFAACSGGGSGGGTQPTLSGGGSSAASTSVSLGWEDAAGPVEGYRVYVQRDGGSYEYEGEVPDTLVTISGPPGQRARVAVVAFDATGSEGPTSPPSPVFTFPEVAKPSAAAALAPPPTTTPTTPEASTRSVATARSQAASDDSDSDATPVGVEALTGALLWQADGALRVTDAAHVTSLLFARPTPGDDLAGVADFDGDGLGDLLWVRDSVELSYTPATSLLLRLAATPAIPIGTLEAGEHVAGSGDFDGDGLDDLLVVRADGVADVWFTGEGSRDIAEVGAVGQATLAAVGDFDANGADDIAWRNPDGTLVIWPMATARPELTVDVALDSGIEVAGAGDFDGDGVEELAVRDARGDLFVLHPLATPAAFEATDVADAQGWKPVGSADVDRDGGDDLVLVGEGAVRTLFLPGDDLRPTEADSPWQLVALLP